MNFRNLLPSPIFLREKCSESSWEVLLLPWFYRGQWLSTPRGFCMPFLPRGYSALFGLILVVMTWGGGLAHLEPDILECEVKWALESITMNKASGGDGIPVDLFQILKDDAVKVLHSVCQQIWKTQQWPQDWKRSVFIPIPKKGNAKECSNYCTIALISHASKVMLKIKNSPSQAYIHTYKPAIHKPWTSRCSSWI